MNRRHVLSILVCLILFGQCLIIAQTSGASAPPKVLWIFREDVKVARGIVHGRVEHSFAQLYAKGGIQPFLTMEAMSGNPTEILFVSGYDSFASFEKDYQTFGKVISGPMKAEYEALVKQESELVNAARSVVAVFRPELSYRAAQIMPDLPKARYSEVTVVRTRPGKGESFAAGAKLYQSVYDKMNINTPWAIYEVAEGAPSGTFLLLTSYKSLKEVDDLLAMEPKIMAAIGEEALKNMSKESADIFVSIESNMYALRPDMSHVPKEYIAADPEFWAPKAKPAPAGETKKPAK
jgi:hypothetical protein